MNLFLAVKIPSEITARILSQTSSLRKAYPDYNWIDPKQYHIPLGYLGVIPEDKVNLVAKHIELLLFDVPASRVSPLELTLSVDQRAVINIILRKNSELEEMHDRIAVFCDPERIKKRARKYTPFISLAHFRIAAKQQNTHFRNKLARMPIDFDLPIEEATLYESIVSHEDVSLREIRSYTLHKDR